MLKLGVVEAAQGSNQVCCSVHVLICSRTRKHFLFFLFGRGMLLNKCKALLNLHATLCARKVKKKKEFYLSY